MTSVVLGRLTSGDAPVADRVKGLEKDPELVPRSEKNSDVVGMSMVIHR